MGSESMTSIELVFEGILLSVIGCLGLLGNIVAVWYFSRPKRRHQTFFVLMLVLAILDLLLIVSCFFVFSLPTISLRYKTSSVWHYTVMFVLPIAQICFTGNTYLTVAISVERYLTICRPLYHRAHSWKAHFFYVPILCFAVVYNIPKFFELQWAPVPTNNTTNYTTTAQNQNISSSEVSHYIIPTDMRTNPLYFQVYFVWMNFIINGVLPFIVLITLNVLILNQLRNYTGNYSMKRKASNKAEALQPRIHQAGVDERRQAQVHMAKISIIIVAIFIVCHSIKWIPNIYEMMFVSFVVSHYPSLYFYNDLTRRFQYIVSIFYRDLTKKKILGGQFGWKLFLKFLM